MRILAIETSCDETAIAVIKATGHKAPRISVLSNIISSQAALHAGWGGVVPNLAKREHQKNLPVIALKALREANFSISNCKFQISDIECRGLKKILEREPELLAQFEKEILLLNKPEIDLIAVTQGPGLEPALWVGVNFARALSYWWDIPLVGINHMEGHVVSALLAETSSKRKAQNAKPQLKTKNRATKTYNLKPITYPALALLVSGGHTELVLIKKPLHYEIIGETRDDAAGEAFDKVARILKLGYPGGPAIAAEANLETGRPSELGCPVSKIPKLPRPMLNTKDFDFSFSGLKTAVLYLVRDLEKGGVDIKNVRPVIAKEFQDAVVDVLVAKTIRAAKHYKAKSILVGGGVAANEELRKRLCKGLNQELPNVHCLMPSASLTGDNALMISAAAYFRAKETNPSTTLRARKTAWQTLRPDANLRLSTTRCSSAIYPHCHICANMESMI